MADRTFLDWPFFESRHRAYAEALGAWLVDADLPHHVPEVRLDQACRAIAGALANGGWLSHAVPDPSGRLDVRTLCLTRQALARHSGLVDFVFAMQGLGAGPISLFGTDTQKRAYLPAVARGEKLAAFALSESDAGSDPAALSVSACESSSGGFILNGEKNWISNAGLADFYIVFARTGEAPGARGISAFIVDANAKGVTTPARTPLIAPHPFGRVHFDNVEAPRDALLGQIGEGFKIAMATLDVFRSTVGAAALGFAESAFDATLARVAHRKLGHAFLGDLQMTQATIADMALAIDTSALLIYRAAWLKDSGAARITREAAMAKLHATESAQRVIDSAVQLHGAQGVVAGHLVESLYREIRALRIYEGASEVQKVIIARQTQANARND